LVLFPDIFFSPLVTIPMAPVITGMTKHFLFHNHLISILRFCILISVWSPSVLHSCLMLLLHLSVSKFYLLCF
jgi:hypothetical protein